jgi:presqualene diphosphate synthase
MTQDDIKYVTELVRQSGSSFYHGMKMLRPERRDAMYGIYAFCRVVDDIADEEGELDAKRAALDVWRSWIKGVFLGQSFDPVTRVLRQAVQIYDLREADFQAVIDGMEMDAGEPIIAPDLATLDLYCDRVASAVGRLSVRIFGDASATAQEVAYGLGRALQLTNILRDVGEDAERGRVYLPYEYLQEAGIVAEPRAVLESPALPGVCARVADLAEWNFQQAEAAMALCIPRAMRPAKLMAASYKPLLKMLRDQKFDYARGRVSLPKWRKLALAGRLLVS